MKRTNQRVNETIIPSATFKLLQQLSLIIKITTDLEYKLDC